MIKIGVAGAAGRMGRWVIREILELPDTCVFSGALESPDSPYLDLDAAELCGLGETGVRITDNAETVFKNCDVVIDFTAATATLGHAECASKHKCALVVGTTGLTSDQEEKLKTHAAHTAIVYSANMSIGVNILMGLVEEAAKRLGAEYDIEIFEAHHKMKKDAPSGTALSLGKSAAAGRGEKFEDLAVYDRDGLRKEGTIGFSVFRGGDIVGEHTVTFAGAGERVELAHKATSREIFAKGALRAALWIKGKPPKLYSMRDVLGV